uniref:Uncharacterized protein n=1 Tax=Siphoviridae sp. ctBLh2 TaxID=2827803 RepID=A0A8S5S427_9CAUD|nr:MAG TPA: hypothetical protein [Siphoviridae sp. ctBLh2]
MSRCRVSENLSERARIWNPGANPGAKLILFSEFSARAADGLLPGFCPPNCILLRRFVGRLEGGIDKKCVVFGKLSQNSCIFVTV